MPRTSDHYPEMFANIPDTVHRLKEFVITLPTPKDAQSLKSYWYGYVKALRREESMLARGASIVLVRVIGNEVHFVDRNQDKMAETLKAALLAQDPEFAAQLMQEEIATGVRNPDGSLKEGFKR